MTSDTCLFVDIASAKFGCNAPRNDEKRLRCWFLNHCRKLSFVVRVGWELARRSVRNHVHQIVESLNGTYRSSDAQGIGQSFEFGIIRPGSSSADYGKFRSDTWFEGSGNSLSMTCCSLLPSLAAIWEYERPVESTVRLSGYRQIQWDPLTRVLLRISDSSAPGISWGHVYSRIDQGELKMRDSLDKVIGAYIPGHSWHDDK